MFDRFVAIGSEFDWITPVLTWLTDLRSGGSVGYNVPVDGGWSALAIEMLLRDAGVRIWGLSIVAGVITFRLKLKQARYAQYLLERNGIPYQGGIDATPATTRADNQSVQRRTAKQRSFVDQGLAPIHRLIQKIQSL
jgi:hypothetical protein